MRCLQTLGFFIFFIRCSFSFAHEGHDHGAPGAIPFAPHGGKAAIAVEADEKDHEEGHAGHSEHNGHNAKEEAAGHEAHSAQEKKEGSLDYFFEATYFNDVLRIYPLALNGKNLKEFIIMDPEGGVRGFKTKIEFPRSKKIERVDLAIVKDPQLGNHWAGKIPANKDIRFILHIEANWGGEGRKASIHLEKRK